MKLRNKKTGKIVKLVGYVKTGDDRMFFRFEDDKGTYKKEYNSLVELNEEWEDYKEPKDNGYWYIDDFGRVQFSSEILDELEEHPNNWIARKLFGNYFSTREEAENAVEKLKAWKRLKDKGFKLEAVVDKFFCLDIFMRGEQYNAIKDDLKIVFGGKA